MSEMKLETEQAKAIQALAALREAAYSVLCESNGLFDNGWRKVGTDGAYDWEMECPVVSLGDGLDQLGKALTIADGVLDPEKTAAQEKWINACETATLIVKLYNDGLKRGDTHPNLIQSSLHRNIADAINGTLKAKDGQLGPTMDDILAAAVARGDLVEFKPSDSALSDTEGATK